ncbi:MAG: hypothetical protein ACI4QF_06110 [Kiritimatiellia bacterium]
MKLNRYPKYKPTGIAWLPEVPEGWEVKPLKTWFKSTFSGSWGKDVPTGETGVVCYRIADFDYEHSILSDDKLTFRSYTSSELKGKLLLAGDLLIEKSGGGEVSPVGRVVRVVSSRQATCSNFIQQVRCGGEVDSSFACYIFSVLYARRITKYFFNQTIGIQNLKVSRYLSLKAPLPPLPTQRAIVAFLDEKCGKIDRWVAAKEREVALLKELKQAMIAEAVTGATHVARNDTARKMKPSGIPWLPEVPEGWEVKKVRQHFRLRSEKVSEQDYPPLSVAKVGVVPQLADVAISMAQGETRKLVREGDYVVNSRSDRKGSCGIAPQDGSVTTISIVLEPRQIDRQFVHYLFRSTPWVEEFYRNGRGIVADLWTTRYQEMRNMVFPLPPLAEQRAIVAYIEARAAKIDAAVAGLEREIAAMKEYKQRLIADVVTGQRKVA